MLQRAEKLTTILAILTLTFAIATTAAADEKFMRVERDFTGDHFVGWVPDQIIVQVAEDYSPSSMRKTPSGAVGFAQASLDAISTKYVVAEFERQFKTARKQFGPNTVDLTRHYKVTFLSGADPLEVVEAFKSDPNIAGAEPIGLHKVYATPNDFYYDGVNPDFPYNQWHYWDTHSIDADQAWDSQTGSASVAVGILDSGLRYFHTDIGGSDAPGPNDNVTNGNVWTNPGETPGNGVDDDGNGYVDDVIGWDFVTSTGGFGVSCIDQDCGTQDNDPDDGNGHGTHVGGTVGAITNNNTRVAGIAGGFADGTTTGTANGCKLIPCRIGYHARYQGQVTGIVNMASAAEAMNYIADLVDAGQMVASINCSWGSSNSGGLGAATSNLLSKGVVICVAAGNSNSTSPSYLGGRGDCLDVAATDKNGNGASFTNHGSWVDVAAPGVEILSTYANPDDPNLNNHYIALLDGTSMASPHVAGIAALIKSCNPTLTGTQIQSLIVNNTTAYTDNRDLGSGIANANLALTAASCASCAATTPVASFSGTPTSGDAPLQVNFTDLSSNNPDTWSWNFGDGNGSSVQNPSHTYTSAGTYTVTLTASNCAGSDVATQVNYITVNAPPCTETTPVAAFSGSPTSGDAPLQVNFSDLSSNNPSAWSWNFGDGNGSTAQNPSHTYTSAGTYTVTLTASNCAGSDQATQVNYITVTQPPQADMHVHSITVTRESKGPNWNGLGTITIMDANHNPVANATVSVTADGPTGGTGSAATNGAGQVSFQTSKTKNPVGEWCFEVTNVTHATFNYNSGANDVTRACESGPVFSIGDGAMIADGAIKPNEFSVAQNHPNPFNPSTKIEFNTPEAGRVEVMVYNLLGQVVATLMDADVSAGIHSVEWNAAGVSSGVYLYSVKFGEQTLVRKMTLLK
ncbi:MAG TPA: PKD domain-containing protein [candidate division Zixibacteria bacterium]|nr:PKD domain-containing protein [candidate division Zixibacteria bacterium]